MTTSDIISLLGIGLAVWALIGSEQKRFILLFFSKFEICVYVFLLAFLHYLIAFDWLLNSWFPSLAKFTHPKGIPAEYYAYMLGIGMILIPICKVSFGFFSKSKIIQLVGLYKTALQKKDFPVLERQIEKYHLKDIVDYIEQYSDFTPKETIDIILDRSTEYDDDYKKLVSNKRLSAAVRIYYQIVQDSDFILAITPKNPHLFSQIIAAIQSDITSDEEFVKEYIRTLFRFQNRFFWKEIKSLQESNESIVTQNEKRNLPIMFSLLSNTRIANKHSVWYPIGEETINSLKTDEIQKEILDKEFRGSGLDEEFKNTPLWISIGFFNSMVRESIYRNSDWHMHLFYYQYFVEEILKISSTEKFEKTYAYKATELILGNLLDWLELNNELFVEHRYIDTYRCLLRVLFSMINSEKPKSLVTDHLERVMNLHFRTMVNGEVPEVKQEVKGNLLSINIHFFNVDVSLVNGPKEGFPIAEFNSLVLKTWDNVFDKVPYEMDGGGALKWSIEGFEEEVISKIRVT